MRTRAHTHIYLYLNILIEQKTLMIPQQYVCIYTSFDAHECTCVAQKCQINIC